MRYLITATLLNSWLWYIKANDEQEKKAREDFERLLKRESWVDNEYMEAGRQFEAAVYHHSQGSLVFNHDDDYSKCVREVSQIIKNGTWHPKGYTQIEIGGVLYFLYGKADVLRGPTIFDIKYVNQYIPGKYFDSAQHKMYFACFQHTRDFEYLVCDGRDVYREKYIREGVGNVIPVIADFQSWLKANPMLEDIYFECWNDEWRKKQIDKLFNQTVQERINDLKRGYP